MQLDKLSEALIGEQIIREPLQLMRSIGGGCINECYQVQSGLQPYFLKVNSASAYPGMFEMEAAGLVLLKGTETLKVPNAVYFTDINNTSYLLMDYIESGNKNKSYWQDCGRMLAIMHQQTEDHYGLDHPNYIGSLPQLNTWRPSWAEFYLEFRMIPQLEAGLSDGWAERMHFRMAESIARVIEDDFPEEPASLLHGDLWSGNLMTGPEGQPVVVDPAVYYGHREMEISFTRLFGGFQPEFYEFYENELPLQPDFSKREKIHQLYPLMVHANLFGGHYVQQVISILTRFR